MPEMTLHQLSQKMAKIDAMLSTRTEGGAIASRPMSNGEVAYRGDRFFTDDATRTVADIEMEAQVGLAFTGAAGLLGGGDGEVAP